MRVGSRCAKRDGDFWRMEGPPFVGNSRFLLRSRVILVLGFRNFLERLVRVWAQWCVLVRGRSCEQRRAMKDCEGIHREDFRFGVRKDLREASACGNYT